MHYDRLEPSGPLFVYGFESHALSTAGPSDLFCVTAPSNSRVVIRRIEIAQTSELGNAAAELLGLRILTGSTLIGGGATLSGRNVLRHSGGPTAASSVTGPSTTLASTASAVGAIADAWAVSAGWFYSPPPHQRIVLEPNSRFVLRQSVPADPVTLFGSLLIQEIS